MMSAVIFILIAYFDGYNAGGPVAVEFNSQESCKAAIVQLEEKTHRKEGTLEWAICVPK